jgi:Zn-dependent protease with chaperone function
VTQPEAVDGTQEGSDVAVIAVYRQVLQKLCTEVDHPGCPEIVIEEKRSQGIAAYHPANDEIVFHPSFPDVFPPSFFIDVGFERAETYLFRGLVLHELGHRAEPGWIHMRRMLWAAAPTLWLLAALYSEFVEFNSITALMCLGGIPLLGGACLVSWIGELRADDYSCDLGGIGGAIAMFDLLESVEAKAGLTHPPTWLRRQRQLHRAGLPSARFNRDSLWRRHRQM